MAHSISFDQEHRRYTIVLTERVDKNDLIEAMGEVRRHPAWFGGVNVCWDGRYIQELLIEVEHTREIQAAYFHYAGTIGKGRAAIVVQNSLYTPLAEFFSILLDSPVREIRVFATFQEAIQWLDQEIPAQEAERNNTSGSDN